MRLIPRLARRFAARSPEERSMFLGAFTIVAVTRASLWVTPVGFTRRVAALAAFLCAPRNNAAVEAGCWAVAASARYIPRATCLTQALAAQALLARAGHDARVEIGVVKDPAFRAHAWLVYRGQTILGGDPSRRYHPIHALEPAAALD